MPVKEVFGVLGIHFNTGYLLIKQDKFPIPVVHIGGRMYCRQADVRAFVEPRHQSRDRSPRSPGARP